VTIPTLASGQSVVVKIAATVDPATPDGSHISNTSDVDAATDDPNTANNTSDEVTTLVNTAADLEVTKTDSPDPVIAGTGLTYTTVVTNHGPSDAQSVSLADLLDGQLSGATYSRDGGTSEPWTSPLDLGSLAAGGSTTIVISTTVKSDTPDGASLSNTATVTSGTSDPVADNNSSTTTTAVDTVADLSITKTDGVTTEIPGTSVNYSIVVSNAGPSDAVSATVADLFPLSLSGVSWSASGTPGTVFTTSGGGNLSETVTIPSGGSITYTVNATISSAATGNLTNTATVAAPAGTTDPTPGNNGATDTDTLTPQADLQVTKTDGATAEIPGTPVTYTIVVSNAGPSDAVGATVADTLPASLSGRPGPRSSRAAPRGRHLVLAASMRRSRSRPAVR
jgi:uncharacterized repeat protein (TIGR01451 family)